MASESFKYYLCKISRYGFDYSGILLKQKYWLKPLKYAICEQIYVKSVV